MRVALLGAAHGHIGYVLTEARETDDVEIVAAAEPDPGMRETFLSGMPFPVSEDPIRLLDETEIDVAVVCGIYADRAAVAAECLRRGVTVLADKPLCTTWEQFEDVRAAAKESGAHLATMFDKRFYPESVAARRLLDDGTLGALVMVTSSAPHKLLRNRRPEWFFRRETYGSIAADLTTHDIDIVLTLTGATSGTVSALTGRSRVEGLSEFDDHVALLLRAGDVPAAITASWLQPDASEHHGDYRMTLVGTEGTAEIDWAVGHVTVTTHGRQTWQEPLPARTRPVQFFFDALRAGCTPDVTTQDTLRATEIALLAQRSADHGGSQEVFDFGV
ncbi:MAG TPA: Gfo/Idh/MocA family oxidoreductase [Actinopolymorphaceae bacterium]